jgi:hypothetical protein
VTSDLLPYLWLLASLGALLVLQHRMLRYLQGLLLLLTNSPKISFLIYAALFLPGVALHEIGHWLVARLLGVRTRGFSLKPVLRRDGSYRLGYVKIAETDPFRAALIGAAPLAVGAAVLTLIGFRFLSMDQLGRSVLAGAWAEAADHVRRMGTLPVLWLWLYLVLSVSNTMLPSAADRAAWVSVALATLLLAGLIALLGVGAQVLAWMRPGAGALARALASVLTLAAAVDLVAIPPLWLAWRLAARLTGREVVA